MQKTRKLISMLLAIMMVLSMFTVGMVSASALPEDTVINDVEGDDASGIDGEIYGLMGDSDGNDKINVKDATQIQKFAAKLITLDETSEALSDVDLNGKVNVKDATAIQKWVAKIPVDMPINCLVYTPTEETTATEPTTEPSKDEPTTTVAADTKPSVPVVVVPTTAATEPTEPTAAPTTAAKPTEVPTTAAKPTEAPTTEAKPTDAPAETITIYFTNNQGWEVVNIYYWGGTGAASAEWPGQAMTYVETSALGEDIYSYQLSSDVEGVVFNGKESAESEKGNNFQTVDVKEGIVDGAGFYPSEQLVEEGEHNDKWLVGTYTYVPKEDDNTTGSNDDPAEGGAGYYLVGELNGQDCWFVDENSADRKLKESSNGEYYLAWTFYGNDKVKVAYYDGTSITEWYKDGMENEYIIGPDSDKVGEGTIYFNPNGNPDWSYTYLTVQPGAPNIPDDPDDPDDPVIPDDPTAEQSLILLRGDFNDWGDDLVMVYTSDRNVVTITIELEAGTYEFKLRDRNTTNTWYGNDGTIDDTTLATSQGGWEMSAAENAPNCKLNASGGTYTFNFNTETKKLVVLHNATSDDPVDPDDPDDPVIPDDPSSDDEPVVPDDPTAEKSLILLRGDFNNWGDDLAMVYTSDRNVVTITIQLEAGTYKFKLRDKAVSGLWYGNDGTIDDTTLATSQGGWEMSAAENAPDCKLNASGGTYTFNFNTETKKLVVLHNATSDDPVVPDDPDDPVVPDDPDDPVVPDDPEEGGEGYYLVGVLNGQELWYVDENSADRKLKASTTTEGEYYLEWTFYENDKVKVAYYDGTEIKTWYKDGTKNEYEIGPDKVGEGTLYFNPEGTDWSYTYLTVQPNTPDDPDDPVVPDDPDDPVVPDDPDDPVVPDDPDDPVVPDDPDDPVVPDDPDDPDPVVPAYEVHVSAGRGYNLLGALSLAEGSETVLEATFEFEAGNIGFKIKDADNTKWYGGATTFTDTCENVVFTTSKDLATLVATGGTYKFTVDVSDADNLSVTIEKIADVEDPDDEDVTIYLKASNVISWDLLNTADERVAVLIDNDTQTEYPMSVVDDAWVVEVPSFVTDITFKRFKGEDLRNTWKAGERNGAVSYYVNSDTDGLWDGDLLANAEFYLVGSFNNWKEVNPLEKVSDNVYQVEVDITTGDGVTFKLYDKANDYWYGNDGRIDNVTDNAWTFRLERGDCKIDAVGGTYKFTVDFTNFTAAKPEFKVSVEHTKEVITEPDTPDVPTDGLTLYLKPNSNWKQDNARFAVYLFGNGEAWYSMTDSDGDGIYEVVIPKDTYPNIIFCRMNPGSSSNDWGNKWTQTADLDIPTNGDNLYTIDSGSWDAGSWSVK